MNSTDIAILASELRATLGMLKRRLRERGGIGDLTPSQTDVLRWLDQNGRATTSKLARECGMRPQSMGSIVSALQAQGLVHGAPDPNDGRQTLITLTAQCRERIARGRAAREDWLADQIAKLPADDQAHLQAAATVLRRIANP